MNNNQMRSNYHFTVGWSDPTRSNRARYRIHRHGILLACLSIEIFYSFQFSKSFFLKYDMNRPQNFFVSNSPLYIFDLLIILKCILKSRLYLNKYLMKCFLFYLAAFFVILKIKKMCQIWHSLHLLTIGLDKYYQSMIIKAIQNILDTAKYRKINHSTKCKYLINIIYHENNHIEISLPKYYNLR